MGSDVGGKPAGSSRDGIGAASTSKRRRIESLEQRFAGRGAPSSSAASATRRPVAGAGAGGGARRRETRPFRARPPRRPLLWTPRRRPRRADPPAPGTTARPAPTSPGASPMTTPPPPTRCGTPRSVPAPAPASWPPPTLARHPPDLARCRDDADPFAARAAASAWVLGLIRELAATNPKAGADVEQVIQSKTKDKSLLLDAANARFSVDEVRAAKERRETRERRRGGSASARATRAKSGAPIIPTTGDGDGASLDAIFAPLRECWWSYAMGTVEGCGGDERGRARGGETSGAGRRASAVALHGVFLSRPRVDGDARGRSCGTPARTLWMVEVGNRNKVVKVPKRGTTFEVEAPAPKRGNSSDTSGGIVPVPGCRANNDGDGSGDNLARVG